MANYIYRKGKVMKSSHLSFNQISVLNEYLQVQNVGDIFDSKLRTTNCNVLALDENPLQFTGLEIIACLTAPDALFLSWTGTKL
jgi:hypothetical protein